MAATVGALMPTNKIPYFMTIHKIMEQELASAGAELLLQKPAPMEMAWKNATRKLITLESKVIIAYGSGTALAAKSETGSIPIVYCGAYAPDAVGLSGGNITGVSFNVRLDSLINNLKKISNFKKLVVLYSSEELESVKQMEEVEALSGKLGFEVQKVLVSENAEDVVLPETEAVFLTSAGAINAQKALENILDQTRARKIATASILSGSAELGVIISLSANPEQQAKDAAKMVADILQGKSVADIPPNSTAKVELTVNVKEATALGLKIPFEILGSAKVIK